MIYTYAIDDKLLDIPESDLELWVAKLDSLFTVIKKRTKWVDCEEGGIYNSLGKKVAKLIKELQDDTLKKQIEELWQFHLWEQNHFMRGCCGCDDTSDCRIAINVKALNDRCNKIPSFVLVRDKKTKVAHDHVVSVSAYKQSPVFKDCTNSTFCQGGPIETFDEGVSTMINHWGGLFKLTKEVTIFDRNVFERWNRNYQNGLKQFAKALCQVNPDISLTIITRYRRKHRAEGDKTDYIIRDEMKELISQTSSPYIKVILSETVRDHDRFILFDNTIGAILNRGLDTFVPSNQRDQYRITYTQVYEVEKIIREALESEITQGDFAPFTN